MYALELPQGVSVGDLLQVANSNKNQGAYGEGDSNRSGEGQIRTGTHDMRVDSVNNKSCADNASEDASCENLTDGQNHEDLDSDRHDSSQDREMAGENDIRGKILAGSEMGMGGSSVRRVCHVDIERTNRAERPRFHADPFLVCVSEVRVCVLVCMFMCVKYYFI